MGKFETEDECIVYFSNFNVRAFELLGIMTCDESPRNDSHDSLERR